jgi:glyoxylase-like metal-dependent hydrolase (beta-lactamase superfamily II)
VTALSPSELEPGLFLLDLDFQGFSGAVAAYLLVDGDDLTLVETGPGSTLGALRAGLARLGYATEQLTRILVTHIHLDHAGAAGTLMREAPRARFLVHPLGAAHMVDPSKLISSATRIYGAEMDRLWGAFEPVPRERLDVLEDGERIRCGGRTLVALHTPGHAVHHLAFHEPESGVLLTGDVAGVRLGHVPYVRPPTPPPDVDLDAWRVSVARMRAADPRRLLLTHFGAFDDAAWHLDELLARLYSWAGWIEARLESEPSAEAVIAALHRRADDEVRRAGGDALLARGYELATPAHMTVTGVGRWLAKRGPAPAEPAASPA